MRGSAQARPDHLEGFQFQVVRPGKGQRLLNLSLGHLVLRRKLGRRQAPALMGRQDRLHADADAAQDRGRGCRGATPVGDLREFGVIQLLLEVTFIRRTPAYYRYCVD